MDNERNPICAVGDVVKVRPFDWWTQMVVSEVVPDGSRYAYILRDSSGEERKWSERGLKRAMNGITPWK